MATVNVQNYYLIRQTDAGSASDGRHVFDLPPVQLLDGDHRSPFVRHLSQSGYSGQPVFIKYVKAPNPEPQDVDLSRGVGLVEHICDPEDHFMALSKRHYTRFEKELDGSFDELHPVSLYRYPGKRSGKIKPSDYRIGTIKWRDTIVDWCDFANSIFDLVDTTDFHRHGTRAMRGEAEYGTLYPLVKTDCRFENLNDFKGKSRTPVGNFRCYVPRRLSLKPAELPALFKFDSRQTLVREDIAEELRKYRKPGSLCPYPPIAIIRSAA